jgi:hypothetical protein
MQRDIGIAYPFQNVDRSGMVSLYHVPSGKVKPIRVAFAWSPRSAALFATDAIRVTFTTTTSQLGSDDFLVATEPLHRGDL